MGLGTDFPYLLKSSMHALQIIVETPKGSQFKYKYDSKKEWFEVRTKGQDGDPLDVLILTEFSFLQGSRIRCNVIGALKAEQSTGDETVRNDRIFVTPELDGLHPVYESLSDLQNEKLKEIENFFVYYNAMQKKEFKPLGILSAKETWKLIKQQRS
jgi:inorganic pyrophosphatase